MNSIFSKIFNYILFIVSCPVVTYVIILIIYMLLFINCADPVLCMGPEASQEVGEVPVIREASLPWELQQYSEDLDSNEKLERLNTLKTLLESDVNKANLASDKYKY